MVLLHNTFQIAKCLLLSPETDLFFTLRSNFCCIPLLQTVQSIAFLACYHAANRGHRSLVLVPTNVRVNWEQEFRTWLPAPPNNLPRARGHNGPDDVRWWDSTPDTCLIITYGHFTKLVLAPNTSGGDGAGTSAQGQNQGDGVTLGQMLTQRADLVIADEGHMLKSFKTRLCKAVAQVRTRRRLVLTGTPLQNNLEEMYAMVAWVDDVLGRPVERDLASFRTVRFAWAKYYCYWVVLL